MMEHLIYFNIFTCSAMEFQSHSNLDDQWSGALQWQGSLLHHIANICAPNI